jgi:electron transfer flavoprotein beta subunit
MILNVIVCMKQVPLVSELPWDSSTGRLKRETAEGMMNPACKHALEAALQIKHRYGAHITAITMGPPMAEEILREAVAAGADRGLLLTDPRMGGADTLITSFTLARAIEKEVPDFDLILCGCYTSDSETAQVGPQLAEELNIAGAAYVEHLELSGRRIIMRREADNFLETLEMDLPGLATITTREYKPRYVSFSGLQDAFEKADIKILTADDLGLSPDMIGIKASPTRIVNVYSPTTQKQNLVISGSAQKAVEELFSRYADKISGAMGRDLKTHDHDPDEKDE